ncbi:hypothetical protein NS44R_14945, partial [Mammaliicoccus sciuri]
SVMCIRDGFRAARAEISAGPAGQQFSGLEAADVQRHGAGDPGVRRPMADLAPQAEAARVRIMVGGRRISDDRGNPARGRRAAHGL